METDTDVASGFISHIARLLDGYVFFPSCSTQARPFPDWKSPRNHLNLRKLRLRTLFYLYPFRSSLRMH